MIYILIVSIIYSCFFLNLVMMKIIKYNISERVNFFTENSLNKYLNNVLKKRKSALNKFKNDIKHVKSNIKYKYKSIFLRKLKLNKNLIKCNTKRKMLWVEYEACNNCEIISKNINLINSKIKFMKYRSFKDKIIINEIAKTYAFLLLNKDDFNMSNHFRKTAFSYKLFKKEIRILPFLIKYYLLIAFFDNMCELQNIRYDILTYSKCKISKFKRNYNYSQIYAISKYNKNANLAILKNNTRPEDATFHVSSSILRIATENRKIFSLLNAL